MWVCWYWHGVRVFERGSCFCRQGWWVMHTVGTFPCVRDARRILSVAAMRTFQSWGPSLPGFPLPSSTTRRTSTQASIGLPPWEEQLFQGRAHWLFPCGFLSWFFLWEPAWYQKRLSELSMWTRVDLHGALCLIRTLKGRSHVCH